MRRQHQKGDQMRPFFHVRVRMVVSIIKGRRPLLRNARHFVKHVFIARARSLQRFETMVCRIKQVESCLLSESLADRLEQFEFRKLVTCSRQKEQGDVHVVEVIGAVRCGLPRRVLGKAKEDKAFHIRDRLF